MKHHKSYWDAHERIKTAQNTVTNQIWQVPTERRRRVPLVSGSHEIVAFAAKGNPSIY